MSATYFSFLTQSLAEHLGNVIGDRRFFRRSPAVVFGQSGSGSDMTLYLTGQKILEPSRGTMNFRNGSANFLVFKKPARVQYSFLLHGKNLSASTKLEVFDKLMTYFFDTQSIQPFVPAAYNKYPALYEFLKQQPASFDMPLTGAATPGEPPDDEFNFPFQYTALYHSGNLFREDAAVSERVIDYPANERSVS